jgi:hypothetical protein
MYHCVRELCLVKPLLFLLHMLPLRVTDNPSYIFPAKHIVYAISTLNPYFSEGSHNTRFLEGSHIARVSEGYL